MGVGVGVGVRVRVGVGVRVRVGVGVIWTWVMRSLSWCERSVTGIGAARRVFPEESTSLSVKVRIIDILVSVLR